MTSNEMTELTLAELEMVTGGSDTVTGKVKFIVANDDDNAPSSDTTTGTVK